MFQLSDETLIMTSDDKRIKLTTHRIIQEDHDRRSQILLEDVLEAKVKSAHIGRYGTLTLIFSISTILLALERIKKYYELKHAYSETFGSLSNFLIQAPLFLFSLTLLTISFFFYLASRRYYVYITGKFNTIQFRITNPENRSILKLLEQIYIQGNKRKQKLLSK